MLEKQPDPKKYEEYASLILNDHAVQDALRKYISSVDIKIKSPNASGLEDWNLKGKSGCIWNVDGYGYSADDGERVLIECKHKGRELEQSIVASFAYVIKDVGAKSGIIVTTLGLQDGAKQLARAENIGLIRLHHDSTNKNFHITFNLLDEPTEDNPIHSIMVITDEVRL